MNKMEIEKSLRKAIVTGKESQIIPTLLHRFVEAIVEKNESSIALIFDGNY